MRSVAEMDGEVLWRHVRQFVKQPRQHAMRWKWPRDIGHDQGHFVCRLDQICERRGSDRVADGRLKFRGFVGQAGQKARLDDA